MQFRGFWGRARRAALAAVIGAVLSVVAAELIAFALLDIALQNWARLFYAGVYLAGAGVLLWLDDEMLMKVYRFSLAGLFAVTGATCLLLMYSLEPKSLVPRIVRVAMFALVGMTLCISVVLSCFILGYGIVEWCCQRGHVIQEALASPGRTVWICLVALLEGIYFGFVLGVLEHRDRSRPKVFRLPHSDTELALPIAALLGGLAGARIEWQRQASSENYYATISCAPSDDEWRSMMSGPEVWLDHGMEDETDAAGIGNVFDMS